MAGYDPTNAEVLVFSFKQPTLLSSAAHDLKLGVARFYLEISGDSVTGEFEAGSLEALCALKDGIEVRGLLTDRARSEIEAIAREKVLGVARYPLIRFESTTVSATEVKGRLSLRGVTRELSGTRREEGDRTVAEFRFSQSDFGIRPYSALLGALKVKDEVLVRISIAYRAI